MDTKQLLIHGGWAVAAAAAFAVGSSRSNEGGPTSGNADGSGPSARSTSRSSGFDSEPGSRLRARQDGQESADRGELASLFGSTRGLSVAMLAEKALKDPNPITRRLAFGHLLESMTAENALEIREQLVAMGADGSEWRDFNYSWGAIAGQEAFDHAAASEEQDLAATMSGWAAANPNEAIAMLRNLPEAMAGQKAELAESVISGLADHDLALATDMAMQLVAEGTGQPDRLIRAVANEALRTGSPADAAAWATTLADGPMKGAAMNRVAGAYVRTNPEEAANWVSQFANEEYAQRAVAEVGEEWGERDPVNALGWLETLPATNGQSDGFRSVFGDWEDSNPVAASEYLAQMPASPQRDAAVSGFVRGYAREDPTAAIAWAEDISDPAMRQESLTQAGQAYYRRDPEAARAWLETSGLPTEAQQAVMNRGRR